jgi:hypothetical protein
MSKELKSYDGIGKVDFKGKTVPFWDYVPKCKTDRCPAFEECFCKKDKNVRCLVAVHYFQQIEAIILKYSERLSAGQLFRIGTGLLPLYQMYFKLKLQEISVDEVVNDFGVLHPVYVGIYTVAEKIEKMWKSTGLDAVDLESMTVNPDFNYYEEMMENDD